MDTRHTRALILDTRVWELLILMVAALSIHRVMENIVYVTFKIYRTIF